MRWQVHQLVGTVVDPVVPSTDPKEPTTVTPAEIIYHRRVRLLSLADELGNVSAACRQMGISRTRYYEWRGIVARYGPDALMPKERRTPQLPNATPAHIVEDLLTLAVVEPTLGCRQYADRLGERGYRIGKTTVQKLLVDHGLGRRAQRVARAAAITAATTGLTTEAGRDAEPFGFCHYSPAPGHLVAADSFYIGNLKGVGKVYQLTAIDVATRWAIILIVIGPVTAGHTIRFVDHVIKTFRRLGVDVRAVLTDNGPEWIAGGFRAHLATRGLPIIASRPAHRTTTRCANDSRAPHSRNAGDRVPPSPLQLHPPTASRSRRLAAALPPPTPQPQQLHARPHPRPDPRQPPSPPSIMTT